MVSVEQSGTILGIVGSPRKDGLTFRHVSRALEGASKAGANVELIQMSDYVIGACRDCQPWVCRENLKCTYDDKAFEVLSEKILGSQGLVMGTPVYVTDTGAQIKLLMAKMNRVFWVSKMNGSSGRGWGLPAFGIAVAGGSGKGMLTGLRPLYQFFRSWRFRAVAPLPVTQFNLTETARIAEDSGYKIAKMAENPQEFNNWDQCQLWYDQLPYLGEALSIERRLLATIILEALPEEKRNDVRGSLTRSEIMSAAGEELQSITEISNICDSGAQIFTKLQSSASK